MLLYAAGMLTLILVKGRACFSEIILVLAGTQAEWEIITEILTIAGNAPSYHKYYEDVTIIPRIIFWIFSSVVTLTGLIIAIR